MNKDAMLRCTPNQGGAMRKVWQWIEVGFAIVALGIVLAFLVYAFKRQSEGAAAWIQAIGSIAAILGAYWIGERQSAANLKHAREMDERALRRRLDAYIAVVEGARDQAGNVARLASSLNRADFYRTWEGQNGPILAGALTAVEQIPLQELGSATAVRALIIIKSALSQMVQTVHDRMESRDNSDHALDRFRADLQRYHATVELYCLHIAHHDTNEKSVRGSA
ncbi:hypothetical protein [Burkholderia cenocepacia]|uniref:hypothetical protein n=2 Tax=Burkholderia TaxID=32008 RepID=UPI00209B7A8E|nr:hypothetical protein [Burkholderia cenocepacia]